MRVDPYDFAGVLFDMDGTLVNTEPLWNEAERLLMADYGVEWTEDDNAHCLGGPTDRVLDYMADRVRDSGQPRPDPDTFWQGFLDFMVDRLTNDPLNIQEGALELLQEVVDSGLPCALVSTSPRVIMDAVLANMGSHWFGHTLAGDEISRTKPDPLPYLQAAAVLGVDPRWCVAVEDSPPGVAAARASGAFVLALTHSAAFDAEPRSLPVPSLTDVSLARINDWFVPPEPATRI